MGFARLRQWKARGLVATVEVQVKRARKGENEHE